MMFLVHIFYKMATWHQKMSFLKKKCPYRLKLTNLGVLQKILQYSLVKMAFSLYFQFLVRFCLMGSLKSSWQESDYFLRLIVEYVFLCWIIYQSNLSLDWRPQMPLESAGTRCGAREQSLPFKTWSVLSYWRVLMSYSLTKMIIFIWYY